MGLGEDLAVAEQVARAGLSSTSAGEVIEVDYTDMLVTVNVAGGELNMPWVSVAPLVGDSVQIGWLGRSPICLGSKYGAPLGVVQTVSGGVATVKGDDDLIYKYVVPAGLTVGSADRVRLDHSAQLVVAVVVAAPPPPAEDKPAPPKPPTSTIKSRWFKPTNSGNYRSGGFHSGSVEISDNRTGVYWYGTQMRDSIPNGATILECKIVLRQNWDNVPGVASWLRLHSQTKPGGTPSLGSGPYTVPGGSRTFNLGTSVGDVFKTGARYGVGFAAGHGWRQYASRATSGQIYIRWRT